MWAQVRETFLPLPVWVGGGEGDGYHFTLFQQNQWLTIHSILLTIEQYAVPPVDQNAGES